MIDLPLWLVCRPNELRTLTVSLVACCEACGTTATFSATGRGWADHAAAMIAQHVRGLVRKAGWFYQSERSLCPVCRLVPPSKERTHTTECDKCGVKGTLDGSYKLRRKKLPGNGTCSICGGTLIIDGCRVIIIKPGDELP